MELPVYIGKWLNIIENMKNSNTYKLAWGRAIVELILESDVDNVTIHFDEISENVLKYYWNQTYFFNLRQGPKGDKKNRVERVTRDLVGEYQEIVGNNYPEYFEKAETILKKNCESYSKQIRNISTFLKQNVCYCFPIVNKEDIGVYRLDKSARTIEFNKSELEEIKAFAVILLQLLNYKWVQLLEKYNMAPMIASKVNGTQIGVKRSALTKFKNILLEYSGETLPLDFYTGKILDENDISVDHVIPWSFIYSDDIWNLVLTSKSNNSSKSNRVPTKGEVEKLKQRNLDIIDNLPLKLKEEMEIANESKYVDKFYLSMKS